MTFVVSVPERSKGVDSSSTVFALVGSNPTADMLAPLTGTSVSFARCLLAHAFAEAFSPFFLIF